MQQIRNGRLLIGTKHETKDDNATGDEHTVATVKVPVVLVQVAIQDTVVSDQIAVQAPVFPDKATI